jgi:capsular exopolysaccharide synthesis family protein
MPFSSRVPAVIDAETYEPAAKPVVMLSQPESVAAEQYRVLRYRLECLQRAGHKALAFTSPQSGDGKTTTVVNAALALAKGGRNRVLLIDADLRRPGVANALGLNVRDGLCAVVAGEAPIEACLWRFGGESLDVLPAGKTPRDLAATLYHPRLGTLLAELKQQYDFVLLDTPPVLPLADVPTLCRDLDGAVLVVRARVTPRELVHSALAALYGVVVHGMVLNDVDSTIANLLHITSRDAQKALPAPSR